MFSSLIPEWPRRRGPLTQAGTAVARSGAAAGSVAVSVTLAFAALCPGGAVAQSMFGAAELEPQKFVLVASPVGSSGRYQLNIYEQVNDRKPCFAIGESKPAAVNPLLATFDFTGICSRYIDANGYSVRVGPSDLAGAYRVLVRSEASDTLLIALPTKAGAGPEMVVARAGGGASGFHKLDFEPGWRLMRRQFSGRNLGHVYLFSEAWPGVTTAPPVSSDTTPGLAPASVPGLGSSASGPAAAAAPVAASESLNVPSPSAPIPLQAAPAAAAPLPAAPPAL